MTKELDLIELFAPQEILRDFDFEKLVDESGIYRIYPKFHGREYVMVAGCGL